MAASFTSNAPHSSHCCNLTNQELLRHSASFYKHKHAHTHTRFSLLSRALCIYPQPKTSITAGMCMIKGGPCACCSLWVIFIMWLIIYAITLFPQQSRTHTCTRLSAHINTESIKVSRGKSVHTTHTHTDAQTHIIPVVVVMREFLVAAYSQTFIRRQAIREE